MTAPQPFSAEPVLAGLTPFQRNTVAHIIDRFYGAREASRFLVADETGLGKTIVARGVIARAIEELEKDDSVDRIDVVYVCSNGDLAHQNLGKLNVTGDSHHAFASRLTLLAKHSRHLRPATGRGLTKPVNLVSFTPGTSFERGWRSGKAEERAMLYLLLEDEIGLRPQPARAKRALRILQGSVGTPERFGDHYVEGLRAELAGDVDETVRSAFLRAARRPDADGSSLVGRFEELLEAPDVPWDRVWSLVGAMRSTLARESVQLLEPDLVILDEFQRFRHLLDEETEAGELAHHLFDHGSADDGTGLPVAKTLLLSATPYKPFTYAEEDEDHHKDFMQVVRWLARWGDDDPADRIDAALARYRETVVAGLPAAQRTSGLRADLLRVMTRTERPRLLAQAMGGEHVARIEDVSADSLLGFVALKDLARAVDAPLSVEYWKSSPYFANFMDGYKVADKVREALKDPEREFRVKGLLGRTRHLDLERLRDLRPLDPDMGNSRLRWLREQTLDDGWWRLLWLPPTLSYLTPGGPYRDANASTMTKRLVFSSWTATPTAVAALLSYEADRLAAGDAWADRTREERETDRRSRRGRLAYRVDRTADDRPAAMAHLALFWPMPGLARLGDPLVQRRTRDSAVGQDTMVDAVRGLLGSHRHDAASAKEASHWFEAFARDDSLPEGIARAGDPLRAVVAALAGHDDPDDPDVLLSRHVKLALACRSMPQDRNVSEGTLTSLAEVAAHSPANIAYRALQRISAACDNVTPEGIWTAAAHLASSLRTLFAKPETTLLLDQVTPDAVYWRSVLRYCAWGNLQSVMDEYLHHLMVAQGTPTLDDQRLLDIARTAGEAIALRPARLEIFDPADPESRPTLTSHFALRYGGRSQEQDSARLPQVRQAFNSPFRPFVLASTSVGQEGIDFHWWCHAIVHWNTPASPIDFEQREGRIDRYDGHAVRRNIAQQHADEILRSTDPDPWDAAYRIAADAADARLGAFAPHWVYLGDAKIQRHVAPFALSSDETRLARLKKDVAVYRLTFGQPRQEDMLELLKQQYPELSAEDVEGMRVDLSAPGLP
ncbi:helicase [Isoptericola hypogeus]|uniref:Helicase n=1 Tax=Isoptericola hypogeus TaxID=300179 RepID=A0ABP4W2E8_9MICO